MTSTTWGEPIETSGKRPDWLRSDEKPDVLNPHGHWVGTDGPSRKDNHDWAWGHIRAIKLPADHPYYTVQRHNAQNGTNFTYWPGGENAPDDWDGGLVLGRHGQAYGKPVSWSHPWFEQKDAEPDDYDIIGYCKTVGPKIADLIDHGFLPELKMPQPVAQWSLKRVREIAGAGAIEYAFARYIEQHEKPPVDPDVLAVREILAAYTLHFDESYVTEDIYKAGEGDGQTWFQAVLEVYRTIKANGGVVK